MKSIVLTTNLSDAKKLRERLGEIDSDFLTIPCYDMEKLKEPLDCEFIFSTWYMPSISKDDVKKYFPKLKAIFYSAGTVKQFAEPFLESGIRIFSSAKANGIPVAEFTAAQIILANKGFFQAQRKYHWPIWKRGYRKARLISENHMGNYGAVIGILGCGSVGSMVVKLLKSYNLQIKVYDPYFSDKAAKELGVEIVSLEEIFKTCNVISNHMPDIKATKGIINKNLLAQMLPYGTLINTGRGAQIKENDLFEVFRKRKDLCALLDVSTHEPLYPWNRLYWLKNIFLSPHIAGSLSEEIKRMVNYSYQSYIEYINGKSPKGEVTLENLKNNA